MYAYKVFVVVVVAGWGSKKEFRINPCGYLGITVWNESTILLSFSIPFYFQIGFQSGFLAWNMCAHRNMLFSSTFYIVIHMYVCACRCSKCKTIVFSHQLCPIPSVVLLHYFFVLLINAAISPSATLNFYYPSYRANVNFFDFLFCCLFSYFIFRLLFQH